MGDRICLTFVSDCAWDDDCPCLYSHWDGMRLIERAKEFWELYHDKLRHEPTNWMVNFISWLCEGDVQNGNYYLHPTEADSADPEDNGYWRFNIDTGRPVIE